MSVLLNRVDRFGDLVVFRRAKKLPGLSRYVVGRDSNGNLLKDFDRKAPARRWARINGGARRPVWDLEAA